MQRVGGQTTAHAASKIEKVNFRMLGVMGKYEKWKDSYFVNDIIDPATGRRKDKKTFNIRKRPAIKDKHCLTLDITNGAEKIPIPVFNEVDNEKLPANFQYMVRLQDQVVAL